MTIIALIIGSASTLLAAYVGLTTIGSIILAIIMGAIGGAIGSLITGR